MDRACGMYREKRNIYRLLVEKLGSKEATWEAQV
jgi:hypothetical protein